MVHIQVLTLVVVTYMTGKPTHFIVSYIASWLRRLSNYHVLPVTISQE